MSTYKNDAQERGYKVLLLLAGKEFTGVTPGELAKAANTSPANITRDLQILKKCGLTEQLPHDQNRWRLGPKLIQVAIAHQTHMTEIMRQASEIQQRYSTYPL